MYLKAINLEFTSNKDYIRNVLNENFNKILTDDRKPESSISNIIMGIVLNRIILEVYPKSEYKNNLSEISKVLVDGKFNEIIISKKDKFDEKSIKDNSYLKYNKQSLTRKSGDLNKDIVIDDKFSYDRINHYIEALNTVLIDKENENKYDYYKSYFIFLFLLWVKENGSDRISFDVKKFDKYLDSMREGINDNKVELFITNAKNSYYNLNPYGELCPIEEMIELNKIIESLNTTSFSPEVSSKLNSLKNMYRRFSDYIHEDNIPEKYRLELFEDDYFRKVRNTLNSIKAKAFTDQDLIDKRIIENLESDIKDLAEKARGMRDL